MRHLILFVSLAVPIIARQEFADCGTTRETSKETLFLHRQSVRGRTLRGLKPLAATSTAVARDIGNIAIIEDSDGAVARPNPFDLDRQTLVLTRSSSSYKYSVSAGGYDSTAAANGSPLLALDDDDTREAALPFAFPFFTGSYNRVFINSDGNLTFGAGDSASIDRSLGRVTSGPPRIAVLFDDLDPSRTVGGVRFLAEPGRAVVSWVKVPEYSPLGSGQPQTFQVKLYPDGRIELSYSGIRASSAVVGIAPGHLAGSATLVSFVNDPSGAYTAAVAERFGDTPLVDVVTVAQKFFQTHEDAYDYLMIYNNLGIDAMPSAVAYENTVRSKGLGYGVEPVDQGSQYGSASRLQSVINMGELTQYPRDPTQVVPRRSLAGDTPLSILGHESGHLFLAFASVRDANDLTAAPMLGSGGVHWSFVFNSEASLVEGERIQDNGANASPRFRTTDTVQGYAPLDQYLMGFRSAAEVPPTFVVTNTIPGLSQQHPARNYGFNGNRRDIAVNELEQVMGRRTPDYTVAQRRFRFAFILVVAAGSQITGDDIAQIDTYRQQFETYYAGASSNRAVADTTLRRSMQLSLFPSAGVVEGGSGGGTLTISSPQPNDVTVQFQAPNGNARFPESVRIPAGATSATFDFTGTKAGVEELLAVPADPAYETAFARIQVGNATVLQLTAVSGDRQLPSSAGTFADPVVVRLTDINGLAYPGARITAAPSTGGSVQPAAETADSQGQVSFLWTPGTGPKNQVQFSVAGVPGVTLTVSAGSAVPVITAVQNGASFQDGVVAGALETIRGVNLANGVTATAGYPWPATLSGVRVLLNSSALPLLYVSDTQINFYVPQDAALGAADLTVVSDSGAQATARITVGPVGPGIFNGAVLHAGTIVSAATQAVHAGDAVEIYCTGLGPTTRDSAGLQDTAITPTVFVGGVPATVLYSGLAPGYLGLYQVNVLVPAGLAPGKQSILISANLEHSNLAEILVQ